MKILSIIERLFVYFQVDSNKKLAEKLGVSNTVLSNWKARNTIDYELIFTKCESVNIDWLITGEGSMLRDKSEVEIKPQTICEPKNEYKKTCELCTEKDKRLQALEMVIEMQKDKIAELQKKKAIVHA